MDELFRDGRLDRGWRPWKFQIMMVFRIQNEPTDLPSLGSRAVENYCQVLLDVLEDENSCHEVLQRAGAFAEGIRRRMSYGREAPERTRAFTQMLINDAKGPVRPWLLRRV